jgi:hypothetical protein
MKKTDQNQIQNQTIIQDQKDLARLDKLIEEGKQLVLEAGKRQVKGYTAQPYRTQDAYLLEREKKDAEDQLTETEDNESVILKINQQLYQKSMEDPKEYRTLVSEEKLKNIIHQSALEQELKDIFQQIEATQNIEEGSKLEKQKKHLEGLIKKQENKPIFQQKELEGDKDPIYPEEDESLNNETKKSLSQVQEVKNLKSQKKHNWWDIIHLKKMRNKKKKMVKMIKVTSINNPILKIRVFESLIRA